MPEREHLEALFLANLGWIERTLAALARRHALNEDAAADAASWVKLRLLEDDYAILAKFRGESAITTYLTVVLAMLFRDYRVQSWGRWRPSAEARRKGLLAVRLETLVHRDRLPLAQAAQTLRTSGETTLSDRQLAMLLSSLPDRLPLRPTEAGAEALAAEPADDSAEDLVSASESAREQRATRAAVASVIDRLAPEDRVILQLRFWEGLSVADIARGLAMEQKPLYRKLERLLKELRVGLEKSGLSRDRTRELLNEDAL